MIEQMWYNLLDSDDLERPLVASDEIDDVVSLMVESRIDPQKFIGNLHALHTGGMPSMYDILLTGEDPPPATPSIKKYAPVFNRPFQAPLWLLAGFPDVLDWFYEKESELIDPSVDEDDRTKATAELFGLDLDCATGIGENQFEDSDVNPHVRHYRNLVSNYVKETGKSLEVAFEEGSENDIYSGMDFLQTMGEESNFTLIAAMTTKYYMELKRTYSSSFPDETSLLAMSGILDANVYILGTQQITPSQIIDLAKTTEGKQDRLIEFLIQFEALLLSVDTPDLSSDEILTACQDQAEAIRRSIQRTMDSYIGEPKITNDVRAVMSSPQFEQLRRAVSKLEVMENYVSAIEEEKPRKSIFLRIVYLVLILGIPIGIIAFLTYLQG